MNKEKIVKYVYGTGGIITAVLIFLGVFEYPSLVVTHPIAYYLSIVLAMIMGECSLYLLLSTLD